MHFSRSLVLSLALVSAVPTTSQAHTPEVSAPSLPCGSCRLTIAQAAAFVVFAACYIRLATKPTAKAKLSRTWNEYFSELATLLNVTQIGTTDYWKTFDSTVIGDQFKLIDTTIKTKDEDGRVITDKDKKVKAYPSGMVGYFDAYVLKNLKTLLENIKHLKECNGFFDGICW